MSHVSSAIRPRPLAAVVSILAAIAAPAAVAETIVGGTISSDTTWDLAGSPYVVTPSLQVAAATLTIEPGVEVRIADGGWIVFGQRGGAPATLIARGTADQPIHFTADAESPVKGSWGSVTFGPTAVTGVRDGATGEWVSGSVIEHCVFSYGGGDYYNDSGPFVYSFGGRLSAYGSVELVGSSPGVQSITCRWSDERGLHADMSEPAGAPLPFVILDSVFEENGPDPLSGDGGGLALVQSRNSLIERCVFRANRVENNIRFGAGLGVQYGFNLTIRDCLFEDNDAERFRNGIGGGLNLFAAQIVRIEECDFFGNAASIGGAIGDYYSNDVTIADCLFDNNETASDLVGGSGERWTVEDCTFTSNKSFGAGGGLSLRGPGGEVRRCVFRNNRAGAAGGAMIWYDTLFEDNLIEDNYAEYTGGGLYVSDSGGWPGPFGAVVANNIVRRNEAGWVGGGVVISLDNSTLLGNEIVDNTAGQSGGGIYIEEPYDEPSMTIDLSGNELVFNTIRGNTSPRGDDICNDLASTSVVVDASGVCWGTTDPAVIEGRVWHGVDDPQAGLVSFTGTVDCAVVGVDDAVAISGPRMGPARPNPMRTGGTTFAVNLERAGWAEVEVFDLSGRRVAQVADGELPDGPNLVTWDGRDAEGRLAPAGTYVVRLDTGAEVRSQKVVVVR